jgi:predicted glycoside hydrolase/deacetylase ChbG (UPF0249 family)
MCHPGHVDQHLRDITTYADQRRTELEILTDASVRAAIRARKIYLISFAEL